MRGRGRAEWARPQPVLQKINAPQENADKHAAVVDSAAGRRQNLPIVLGGEPIRGVCA